MDRCYLRTTYSHLIPPTCNWLHTNNSKCILKSLIQLTPTSGQAEDDGVLLGTVLHSDDKKKVTLLVLNAADMTELARATFTTASDVPRSLHGCFLPA